MESGLHLATTHHFSFLREKFHCPVEAIDKEAWTPGNKNVPSEPTTLEEQTAYRTPRSNDNDQPPESPPPKGKQKGRMTGILVFMIVTAVLQFVVIAVLVGILVGFASGTIKPIPNSR